MSIGTIGSILSDIVMLYSGLVLLYCLLTWFNVRWYEQPFKTLDRLVQPVLAPFRQLIPPINNIDISPMVAMMIMQMCAHFLKTLP